MGAVEHYFSKGEGSAHDKLKKVSLFHRLSGGAAADQASEDAMKAAKVEGDWKKRALEYMMNQERLPTELRDFALKGLGGLYGLPGYEDTLDLTSQAQGSPIYQAMLQQIDQSLMEGQDASGREASVGGFLRSGPLAQALAEQRGKAGVSKAGALSSVYQQMLGGIQNLAGMPSNTNAIAAQMGDIGSTLGQGIVGSAQTAMAGQQNKFGSLGNLLGGLFSDVRLKDNIRLVGKVGKHNWYAWEWNENAHKLGIYGTGEGVMAHEIQEYAPEAVGEESGYMTVNYDRLRLH